MSVRTPGGDASHKSFRLTRPVKMKFIARAFGKTFIPGKFQKTIKSKAPGQAKTGEERYFLRQTHSDQTLTTQEQMKRFSKGLIQEAHEEGAQLRPGFNTQSNETEQSQRLLKTYRTETEKERPWKERVEHRQQLDSVRQRLGILHGPPPGADGKTPAGVQEPTPLDHRWSGGKSSWGGPKDTATAAANTAASPAAPSLSGSAGPFLGGNVSAVVGRRPTGRDDIPSTVQVRHHTVDILYLGHTIDELTASRLSTAIGLTVESRRAVTFNDRQRTYAIVIVEDDVGQTAPIQPTEVPRPRTAMVVFCSQLSPERRESWQQVGATEIIADRPTFDSVQSAINRYIHRQPAAPVPPAEETRPESGTVHELPI